MSILSSRLCGVVVCLVLSHSAWAKVQEYHLNISEKQVNLTGKSVKKISLNGQFPAPLLEFEEGDDAVIHVTNQLKKQESSVHWHGLLLPGLMDGVPGFNGFNAIQPNQTFTYRFKVRQSGTYWYHAHSKGQEQDGLYGALVIYPKNKKVTVEHEKAQRDYVVMLSDFHESSSTQIMANLKKSADFYQNQRETVGDVWQQLKTQGAKATWQDRKMWNQMRMLKTDLSDVTGYTFLVNGKTPKQNWTAQFKPNEKVRLRFINAAAMSFFDVRIPHLKMTLVAADGQAVKPVQIDEFRIGAAETYDVIVEPQANAYQIEAESIDRSGFALASLKNELKVSSLQQMSAPKARPRALLSMQDMGHSMPKMDAEHSQHKMNAKNQAREDDVVDHAAMGHSMPKMEAEHSQHKMNAKNQAREDDVVDHTAMEHSIPKMEAEHQQSWSKPVKKYVEGWANAATPTGLKALQYSDLISLKPQLDTRAPSRELVIHLGGSMERYIWTLNGKKFNQAEALNVQFGERIRIKFVNDSMMAHPMHLHGMFMQLENGQDLINMPNKHTIVVPPGQSVSALLTADELGEWAIHCHLLYHMSAGMMGKLVVGQVTSLGGQDAHH